MAEPVKNVVPRYRPKSEKFDREMSMDEIMVTSKRDHGMRVFGAVEKSYDQAPGFAVQNGNKVPLGQTTPGQTEKIDTIGDLMEEAEFQYQALDCSNPQCNGKGTVQPLSQEMVDWQCSDCSQNYVMKG